MDGNQRPIQKSSHAAVLKPPAPKKGFSLAKLTQGTGFANFQFNFHHFNHADKPFAKEGLDAGWHAGPFGHQFRGDVVAAYYLHKILCEVLGYAALLEHRQTPRMHTYVDSD